MPISKTSVQAIESDKIDPEVTAALRKHKRLYALMHAELTQIYKQQAETTARVQKSMQIVQELSVKVGHKGDLDEEAQNELEDLQAQYDPVRDDKAEYEEQLRVARAAAAAARKASSEMTTRLELAQKKQTSQEFVQRSYIASTLTALKSVLSIKDGDATDHKSKIAQPVSLVTNCKTLLGDLEIDKLINTPGPMNAVRLKEFITALLHTVPVGMSAIAGPLHMVMEQSGFQHHKVAPACLHTVGMDYDHPNRLRR